MTLEQFTNEVNKTFVNTPVTPHALDKIAYYALTKAKTIWPEVETVKVGFNPNSLALTFTFTFKTEKDEMWWKLKCL